MSEPATVHQIVPAPSGDATIYVIDRLIRDPGVDLTRVEHAIALRERMLDRMARESFDQALAECQSEIKRVAADADNPHTKSRYASYAALDRVVRPVYTDKGFSLSFGTADGAPAEYVRVICRVSHKNGHRENYHIDMPADGKGAQGRDVMTKTHATGSAVTYGMRYLLKMIFNVAIGEDDDDGNGASATNGRHADTISEPQVVQLAELIKETKSNLDLFCRYFKIECLPQLPAKDFDRAIAALEAKKKKGAA